MKKIFTLAFSIALISSAFAQSDRRGQYQRQTEVYQQSQRSYGNDQYSNDGYDRSNSNTVPYDRNSNWSNRQGNNDYAYNNNGRDRDDRRDDRYRNYGDRDEHIMPRYYGRRDRDDYQQARFPLLQIILGIGGR